MAGAKVKCLHCESQVDKESCRKLNNRRYVCESCYDVYNAEQSVNQAEADAYKELIEYVCNLFEIKAPSMLILSQIKNYKEKYNFTYQGMKATLNYFFEMQGNTTEGSVGVGIIPYMYAETKTFYDGQKQTRERLEDCDMDTITQDINVIKIKRSGENNYINMSFIPLDEIGLEDDNAE